MAQRRHSSTRMLVRESHMRSLPFANRWEFTEGIDQVAMMTRHGAQHRSTVEFADGTEWSLEPSEWGVVVALEDGQPIAEILRRSWWGRRWEVRSPTFDFNLISRPRLRSWYFAAGGEPVAEWKGSPFSYNRLTILPSVGIPVVAALLAWQVLCRPWDNSARPVSSARIDRLPRSPLEPENL